MAILKKIYSLSMIAALAAGLTSCYSDFDPDIDSTPVLCMNSTIIPDEPISLFLTHTWTWTEGAHREIDIVVRNAKVRLTVNGEFKENLTYTKLEAPDWGYGYDYNSDPNRLECYQSTYLPQSGDIIRIEASSEQYGVASAEVIVPQPVPVERIEVQVNDFKVNGDMSGFPAVADRCEFTLDFKLTAYFTDPSDNGNYYELKAGSTRYIDYGDEATAYIMHTWPDFSGEPLVTEHVSELESAFVDTSGYTIFSDRQINGQTYPLRIGFNNCSFYYQNPQNLSGPKEVGMAVYLRHLDPAYYKHVLSVWEGNDGLTGTLGGVGLASPVYPYSNVSTGAGVVAAYTQTSLSIPMIDIIELAQQGIFK